MENSYRHAENPFDFSDTSSSKRSTKNSFDSFSKSHSSTSHQKPDLSALVASFVARLNFVKLATDKLDTNKFNTLKQPVNDIEKNVKALLSESISKMDLVSREEFERQVMLLNKANAKLSELEHRVDELEKLLQ